MLLVYNVLMYAVMGLGYISMAAMMLLGVALIVVGVMGDSNN